MLHVYFFDVTHEWYVATSSEAACELWRDQNELLHEEQSAEDPLTCKQCPDGEVFSYSHDSGETYEEKTFGEWAIEQGPGWFAREL